MKLGRQLRVAAGSLWRHKVRSVCSAMGVVLGVAALVAMLSVAEGAEREILEQIEQLGTNNLILRRVQSESRAASGARQPALTPEDVQLLEDGVPGLRSVAPLTQVAATLVDIETQRTPEVLATTRAFFDAKDLFAAEGRVICGADVSERSRVCVLGAEVARALGVRGRVGANIRVGGVMLEVVGVLLDRSVGAARSVPVGARDVDHAVFVPWGSQAGLGAGVDPGVAEVHLRLQEGRNMTDTAAVIQRTFDVARGGLGDYQLIVPLELIEKAYRTRRIMSSVLLSVALLCLLVGGTGIMGTLLASVYERTREIGIRRAVGASRGQIMAHFLCEASLLTLLGGLLGVGVGAALARTVTGLAGWETAVTTQGVVLALAMAVGVGLISGLYPARRAALLDPIRALRHP